MVDLFDSDARDGKKDANRSFDFDATQEASDANQKMMDEVIGQTRASDNRNTSYANGVAALAAVPADGSGVTRDKSGDITSIVNLRNPHGATTTFKYDANHKIVQMTDSRGTYVSADQLNWYKDVNRAPRPANWRGTVEVSPAGTIKETSVNGAFTSVNLDGSKTVQNAVGGKIVTNKDGKAIEIVDAKGEKSTIEYDADGKKITAQIDSRGAFYTKDGKEWFHEDNDTDRPDWIGTVSVNSETGMIEERDEGIGGVNVTRWDLNGRAHLNEGTLRLREFSDRAGTLFSKLDYDGDGLLTDAELGRAVQDADLVGKDAQVVAALHKSRTDFKAMRGSHAITREDLQQFKTLLSDMPDHKLVQDVGRFIERTSFHQHHRLPTSLYADQKEPLASISGDAIKQGAIGNCYFEAALSSVAGSRPHVIRDMVTDNKDGTATVRFGKDPTRPITVPMPTEAELGLYSQPTDKGLWPQVLEKAHGEYLRRHEGKPGLTSAEGADGGGQSRQVIEFLTGDTTGALKVNQANEQAIHQELTKAFATRRAVTAGIDRIGDQKTSVDGYYNGHAYSVVGWNPDGPDGGTLTIRNPWGERTADKYGTFTMSMQQFSRNFTGISYQQLAK